MKEDGLLGTRYKKGVVAKPGPTSDSLAAAGTTSRLGPSTTWISDRLDHENPRIFTPKSRVEFEIARLLHHRKAMATASPKRKRVDDTVPSIETNQINACPPLHPDSRKRDEGSPRTVVASRLQHLNLENEGYVRLDAVDMREHKRARAGADDAANESPDSSPCPPSGLEIDATQQGESVTTSSTCEHESGTPKPGSAAPSSETRPRSPSLLGDVNDLYWMDAEITGHNPNDPTDDGYGINGIGFRPTAGQAYQRSQRRKQQLAEYRSRELKDARQRRTERRRMASVGDSTTVTGSEQTTRVRFEDG